MLSPFRAANEAGAAELEAAHREARAQGWRRASREPVSYTHLTLPTILRV